MSAIGRGGRLAVLKVLKGDDPGATIKLRDQQTIFGRHPNCQIVLDDAAVSRQHAQIVQNNDGFYLEDLKSRNGTQLNGVSIGQRMELNESDTIEVGDFVFQFSLDKSLELDPGQRVEIAVVKLSKPAADNESKLSGLDSSSIIATFSLNSSTQMRLGVNPEEKLHAILEISNSLRRVLQLDQVLNKILEALFKVFVQADEGVVLIKNPKSDQFEVKATKTRTTEGGDSTQVSMTIIDQAVKSREAILSADAAHDDRFQGSMSVSNLKIRSVACVPLLNTEDEAFGVIQITTNKAKYEFSQDDLDLLVSVGSQASLAIENAKLHEAELRSRDLERELEFATKVQLSFLPNRRLQVKGYEFHHYYEAAHCVGGDSFDYITFPDGKIAISIADVSGNGVPAALLMAKLYSSTRYHLLTKPTLADAMAGLNAEFTTSTLGFRFITCAMMVIDPRKHELKVANAGHLPPLRRDATGHVEAIGQQESGMPFGIVYDQKFQELTFSLKPDDIWLLYTDGVTEALNLNDQLYGRAHLSDYISQGPPEIESLATGIIGDVKTHCEGRTQSDDICLTGVQRLP